MKMRARGLAMLARFEGIVPGPYRDGAGVWTYGVGHTAAAGAPDPCAMPRGMPADLDAAIRDAVALFRRDITRYEAAVVRAVGMPMTQHQFDALVSWHYNTGAVATATLTRRLNEGDRAAASAQFAVWTKAGGSVNAGLVARRAAERAVFDRGDYPAGTIPVWSVDAGGRVSFARTAAVLAESAFDNAPVPASAAGWWEALIQWISRLLGKGGS